MTHLDIPKVGRRLYMDPGASCCCFWEAVRIYLFGWDVSDTVPVVLQEVLLEREARVPT